MVIIMVLENMTNRNLFMQNIIVEKQKRKNCFSTIKEFLLPLSKDEEDILISFLESEYDKDVKNILVERNMRLVVYLAKKYQSTNELLEDLISIGNIGLIKAANSFNNNKNVRFATYASRCIENEIRMHLRKYKKISKEISIDEPLNYDKDGNELILADTLCTEADIVTKDVEKKEDIKILYQALDLLDEKDKKIIELRYGINTSLGKEKTQKEVANILGISQSYISRVEKRILKQLKKDVLKLNLSN